MSLKLCRSLRLMSAMARREDGLTDQVMACSKCKKESRHWAELDKLVFCPDCFQIVLKEIVNRLA